MNFKMPSGNKHVLLIILAFLSVKLLALGYYHIVWWDSAVSIGMGKYIYSFGNSGLWEEPRPLVWPLMLGFLWKTGFDAVLAGRILEILFGSLCILMTFLIGRKLFDEKTALLGSLFLAVSPAFFFFDGIMLTEIVSAFFALSAVYLLMSRKYYTAGLLFGIAFMTRFLQLLAFMAVVFIIITYDKKNIKNIIRLSAAFLIPVVLYLALNQILYHNALLPFLQQIYLSKNTGWLNFQPITYYFAELFKENVLYLLSFFGIFLVVKEKNSSKMHIAAIFLFFFVFFNLIKQKEMRFLIVLLPYMYLLLSSSIVYLFGKFENRLHKALLITAISLSLAYSAYNINAYYQKESGKVNPYAEMESKFVSSYGRIWASNPVIAVSGSQKIETLMYYPFFSTGKKNELIEGAADADFIFMDSCDLACRPSDINCENAKAELISHFKKRLKTIHSSSNNNCQQLVLQG